MKQTVAEFAASRRPSNKGRRTPASVAMQKKAAKVAGTPAMQKKASEVLAARQAMPTAPVARRSSAPLPPRIRGMATAPKGNRRMQYNKGGSVGKLNTGIKSC